jgi:UDP-hydrolysing UDP-N-acetyl-D-glucosamine 2-epimerase
VSRRSVAVVTGSRADYGLLRPVMRAVRDHESLELHVVVAGAHLLPPACTAVEVAAEFPVAATVPMQRPGGRGRFDEAEALGRGIEGLARWVAAQRPDVVVVLGDRVEAFAAAAAGAVSGVRVAHLHAGDRAVGICDEGLRHAITKLAHIHLPATQESARRLEALGEDPQRIHLVGSPAVDGLEEIPALAEEDFGALGRPEIVFLLHPSGGPPQLEGARAAGLLALCRGAGAVVALEPNHDPGREPILEAIEHSGCPHRAHLRRDQFVGLLRRSKLLVGNSSAGLIEAAVLGVRSVNVGPRQAGRERPPGVIDVPDWDPDRLRRAIAAGLRDGPELSGHPYGEGRAGNRTAVVLASFDPRLHPLAKRNTY